MSRMLATLVVAVALLIPAAASVSTQVRPLTIVSATPEGEVGQMADANEIRIVFSEPMIALGGPVTGAPPWLTIAPAIQANYFWSGTRTLIVTADPSKPLPYATRYTITIDGSARSAAGRTLGTAHRVTFTTPTPRLLGAEWYRRDGRYDSPAIIALRFNQPMRPADVAAHAHVRYASHAWQVPFITGASRAWLEQNDPAGLARFDQKVAAVQRVASSTDPVAVQPATSWDEHRFPRSQDLVVLETTSPALPEGWLSITLDGTLPSPDGPETHAEQTTTIRLEPAFFIGNQRCSEWCDPDAGSSVQLRRGVRLEEMRRALTVRDLGDGATARDVAAARPIATTGYVPPNGYNYVDLPMLGFDRQPPASTWLFRVDPSLQAQDGQRLDYPWVLIVENVHQRPLADWSGDVWEAAGGPRVPFFARNVVDAMEYVAPLTAGERVSRVMSWGRQTTVVPPVSGTERRFAAVPNVVDAHGIDLSKLLGPRGTGAVWAAILPSTPLPRSPTDRSFGQPRAALLQVTNLGVTVKDSPQSTLVFVTRLDNAQPVPGASVALFDRSSREVWRGATDGDGIAMAPALDLRDPRRPWDVTYLLTAEKDGDIAWVRSDWTGDVHPSRFGLPTGLTESADVLRGEVFTDRGVYVQGEGVRLKSVVRLDSPNGMRLLPAGTAVDVEVRDSRGQQVDKRTLQISRWSSIDWTWHVAPEAPLGQYRVSLSAPAVAPGSNAPQTVVGSFLVAAFRRPDFRVDATVTADPAVLGNPLSGTLTARYLFGAPIGAQPVRWFVRREVVYDVPRPIRERYPEQPFAFGYLPRQDSGVERFASVTERNERLRADGTLSVSVPTESGADFAAAYRLEGDVEGVAGQHIANRAAVTIHPASFYIGVSRPPFFVDLQKPLTAAIVAANLDGTARANVPVTVSLFREQWTSEPRPGSPYSFTWIRKELPAGEWKVTTSADRVSMPVPIKEGGSYVLRATARDERGRPARTDVAFYALGRGRSLWRSDGNRIDLTPERRTWKPGETARILVQSPWERATALVTTEREGIRSHRRVSIASMQDTIEVPITEADVPNVYVSVLLVKGRTADDPGPDESDAGRPAFRVGYTELTVDDASKRLRVDVNADRQEYRPRQDVRVSVSVADQQGSPRAGEVTLWAMDYGLLSLTDYKTPDLARAIYARKQLQVLTQDNRSRLIGRRTTVLAPGQPGQGGRGGGAGLAVGVPGPPPPPAAMARMDVISELAGVSVGEQVPDVEIRTDFRPLVFWLGSIETAADGRATTTVTLPDSLTTYRIMAVAGDVSSHFGAGESEIRASKPLTMLPAFPRFLSRGDRATFGAVVTNGTGTGGDATVTIRSLDAPLAFDATTTQTLRLAPGESAPVRFDAVAFAPGRARVRMTVALGAETDAFELALPVIAPARLETVAAYGDTTSSAVEKLLIPPGIVPTAGGLSVSLASTALVGLGESARYLDEYPYDCAEQRASRALALLLSADLGGAFALTGIKPDDYRAAGTAALNQLYQYQCGNGGFALWAGRCQSVSPYLTAYILNVMNVAGSLQVETNRNAIDRALSYLQNELRQPPPEVQWWPAWSASHAYAVKVLAEFGRNPSADISSLYGAAERMPIFALSYLADALDASGDRGSRYQDVVRRLTNALRTDADRAHVEEMDDSSLRWLWNSNVRATAVVLGGIARRRDAETFAAPLVRWLLAARTNGRWGTTQENAVALEALVNYYKAFEAETPQMTATVTLGGARLGGATFAGRTTTAEQLRVEMPDLVRQVTGAVTRDLVVSRTGTGRLYYTARLQYLPVEAPPPVDRGLRVARKYQRFTPEATGDPATSFASGDLVRVTLTVTLPHEGRFLAFTDPVPAGFEPIDGTLKTTASDLGEQATRQSSGRDWLAWWRRGGFDHVEKHDDRVVAFATRLAAGRHEFTYLVRATTAGTFNTPGTWGEAMYAPEINGRGAATVVTVR